MLTSNDLADNQFFAPVAYNMTWPLVGAGLIVLCFGWVAWVWLSTRPGNHAEVPGFVAPRNPDSVRRKYLELISAVQSQYDAGRLGSRDAHLELSVAVRSFVHEMTGVRAQRMTLAELRAHQLPLVADAVATYYPAEFGASVHAPAADGVALSAERARNVVISWR